MPILNREGYESTRNLGRPYRPVRMVGEQIHSADNMKFGPKGEEKNTTGCFGVKTKFAVRAKQYGPQKGKRRERKRKNVCKLPSGGFILRLPSIEIEGMMRLRRELLCLRVIEETQNIAILPNNGRDYHILTQQLIQLLPQHRVEEMYRGDAQQTRTIEGSLRKNPLGGYVRNQKKITSLLNELGFVVAKIKGN